MAKPKGFTFCIATRRPKETYVFCKWLADLNEAIAYAQGEINDRSQYDVDLILIRDGITDANDPVIWDSRKDMPKEPEVGCNVYLTGTEQAWLKAVKLASAPADESLEDGQMRVTIYSKLKWYHQIEPKENQ